MAKEKKDQDKTQEELKKKGRLKLIIILLVILSLLGGGGYFAYKKFFAAKKQTTDAPKEKKGDKKQEEEKTKDKGEKKAEGEQPRPQLETSLVQLPTIIVNLADPLGKRYLKVSIEIEVKGKDPGKLVEEKMAMIKDTLIMLLSSKTFDDISSLEKKYALKMEIAQRLNQIFEKPIVTKVYFTDFLVQ